MKLKKSYAIKTSTSFVLCDVRRVSITSHSTWGAFEVTRLTNFLLIYFRQSFGTEIKFGHGAKENE